MVEYISNIIHFEPGEDFEDYLKEYHHGTMILNVKSERIEFKILEMLSKYDVKSYFFWIRHSR